MTQYKNCYQEGVQKLEQAGVPEASWDARLLLEYVCGTTRNDLLVHGDREVSEEYAKRYEQLLEKRMKRIPLQHLTGEQEFMGLVFQVNEHVLIPRQDTEILVEQALKVLKPGMRILDMCTGSGCILLSLLALTKGCSGVGADISTEALKVAEANGNRLLKDAPGQVHFMQSDLFGSVQGTFDVLVSNPPYIPTEVIKGLMPEVREHEPMQALDGSEDGLLFYRRIAGEAGKYLNPDGRIFLEIGYDQGEAVSALLRENGYIDVKVMKDYAGLDRVVLGRKE